MKSSEPAEPALPTQRVIPFRRPQAPRGDELAHARTRRCVATIDEPKEDELGREKKCIAEQDQQCAGRSPCRRARAHEIGRPKRREQDEPDSDELLKAGEHRPMLAATFRPASRRDRSAA